MQRVLSCDLGRPMTIKHGLRNRRYFWTTYLRLRIRIEWRQRADGVNRRGHAQGKQVQHHPFPLAPLGHRPANAPVSQRKKTISPKLYTRLGLSRCTVSGARHCEPLAFGPCSERPCSRICVTGMDAAGPQRSVMDASTLET